MKRFKNRRFILTIYKNILSIYSVVFFHALIYIFSKNWVHSLS